MASSKVPFVVAGIILLVAIFASFDILQKNKLNGPPLTAKTLAETGAMLVGSNDPQKVSFPEIDMEHGCGHDEMADKAEKVSYAIQSYAEGSRSAKEPTWGLKSRVDVAKQKRASKTYQEGKDFHINAASNPNRTAIRIHVDTSQLYTDSKTCFPGVTEITFGTGGGECHNDNKDNCVHKCSTNEVFSVEKRTMLINDLIPKAKTYFESLLKVDEVQGNLNLTSNSGTRCTWVTIASSYITSGVSNTDLVVFVTARPTYNNTIAWALDCEGDQNGRPISGHVNFGPRYADTTLAKRAQMEGVFIHELTHVLGFSKYKYMPLGQEYTEFVDANNNNLKVDDVISNITVTNSVSSVSYTVKAIGTPLVLEEVRKHYGCNTLAGGPLEDAGEGGTKYSHWEKRTFFSEYMVGSAPRFPVFSKVTAALLQDSGWYDVDFSSIVLQPLLWGSDMGCSFVENSCASWPAGSYRCSISDSQTTGGSKYQCTGDRLGKGSCSLYSFGSNLIPEYRYFSGYPNVGGRDELADFCPYFRAYMYCEDTTASVIADFGDVHGPSSRCFTSSLVKVNGLYKRTSSAVNGCYKTGCASNTLLKIKLGDTYYDCDYSKAGTGGSQVAVANYTGSVQCPGENPCGAIAKIDTTWPIVTSMYPLTGDALGGDKITIYGKNFKTGFGVWVGGVPCTDIQVEDSNPNITVITATTQIVKHHIKGDVPVAVTVYNPSNGQTATYWTYKMTAIDILNQFWEFVKKYAVLIVVGLAAIVCLYSVYKEQQYIEEELSLLGETQTDGIGLPKYDTGFDPSRHSQEVVPARVKSFVKDSRGGGKRLK